MAKVENVTSRNISKKLWKTQSKNFIRSFHNLLCNSISMEVFHYIQSIGIVIYVPKQMCKVVLSLIFLSINPKAEVLQFLPVCKYVINLFINYIFLFINYYTFTKWISSC